MKTLIVIAALVLGSVSASACNLNSHDRSENTAAADSAAVKSLVKGKTVRSAK